MHKVRGLIKKLSNKAVTFITAEMWKPDVGGRVIPVGRRVEVTLPANPEILDNLVANCLKLVELHVEGGKIVGVEKVELAEPSAEECRRALDRIMGWE